MGREEGRSTTCTMLQNCSLVAGLVLDFTEGTYSRFTVQAFGFIPSTCAHRYASSSPAIISNLFPTFPFPPSPALGYAMLAMVLQLAHHFEELLQSHLSLCHKDHIFHDLLILLQVNCPHLDTHKHQYVYFTTPYHQYVAMPTTSLSVLILL